MPPSFGNAGLAPEPTRLRQIALVVKDLDKARDTLVGLRSRFLFLGYTSFLVNSTCSILFLSGLYFIHQGSPLFLVEHARLAIPGSGFTSVVDALFKTLH
jgi:hypothetical protein